jgi:hypothetical protein
MATRCAAAASGTNDLAVKHDLTVHVDSSPVRWVPILVQRLCAEGRSIEILDEFHFHFELFLRSLFDHWPQLGKLDLTLRYGYQTDLDMYVTASLLDVSPVSTVIDVEQGCAQEDVLKQLQTSIHAVV